MTVFLNWLGKLILEFLWGKGLDAGKTVIDVRHDDAVAIKDASKLRAVLKKKGATDAEIEQAMLDLSNGSN